MSKLFEVPDYLTGDLVEYALQKGLKCKNIHVRNVVYSAGSSGGDNYCSDIIRAKVTFSKGGAVKTDVSLIIKCIQRSESRDLLIKMGVFDTEEKMFLQIIPKIENILERTISPKCYFTCLEPTKTFFMDDLGYYGYKIGDRTKKLDLEHTLAVMKHLGQFHAGSMILAEKFPDEAMKVSKPTLFPTNKDDLNDIHFSMFVKTFKTFISVTADIPKFERISWKLRKFSDTFLDIVTQTYDSSFDKLKVINHGDCWLNNIMFKYSQNKPVDVKFIDFQFSYLASPGIDINYFLNTSCQVEVLRSHRSELLKVYYKSLTEILQKKDFTPIPSYEDIKYEVFRKEFYGFMAFATLSPIMSMDSEASTDNDFSNIGSEEKQKQIFQGKIFLEQLDFCLDRYDKLGIFDL
ncbi:hypothetical protein ACFFRR_002939 [Megaselia abdita]